ncbi:MAG: UDP-N-acetylmuramoyl-L-alanine--D-glutamate ligase [Anaerovoracaceae bacterium]
MEKKLNFIEGKHILVVGLGRSGKAAVQAMVKLGAKVSVQDSKSREEVDPQLMTFLKGKEVTCYFNQVPKDLGEFDMLILSPGVSPELEMVKNAKKAGAEVIGELEIAYRIGQGNYVAITGTNGKTTTTTLVGEIYQKAKKKTYVVGNIGVAVISKALSAEDDAWLITETSSFQLETIKYFKPEVSAILNLTPDHMDRHKTIENYGEAKANIFKNQDENQYLVINYDDKGCLALAKNCKAKIIFFSRKENLKLGAFVKDGKIVIKNEGGELISFCNTKDLSIPGSHNLENALAAAAICYFGGIDPEVIREGLVEFQGVEHRIEFCGQVDGVRFVNDSKGTNPDASIKAVEAMEGGVVLIGGGYDKGSSFTELIQAFGDKVKHLVLLGKTGPIMAEEAKTMGFTNCVIEKDMEDCVKKAFALAEPGDTVLLSPACASWDMYTNFEQRGEHFKSCVQRLAR